MNNIKFIIQSNDDDSNTSDYYSLQIGGSNNPNNYEIIKNLVRDLNETLENLKKQKSTIQDIIKSKKEFEEFKKILNDNIKIYKNENEEWIDVNDNTIKLKNEPNTIDE